MWYNKKILGILVLWTLSLSVIFADYGIIDSTSNDIYGSETKYSMQFPTNLSFSLVRRHLLLAYDTTTLTANVSGPVDYIKMLEDGIRFDVVDELAFVEDKWLYLTEYLSGVSQTLSLVDAYTTTLEEKIDRSNDERSACIDNKKEADELFFASLSAFDQEATDRALQQSMAAWSCEESARISIVATTLQLRRISQLHEVLAAKQELLVSNTSMIIHYFPLVQKELLQKLLVLSSQLQNYTTSLDQ